LLRDTHFSRIVWEKLSVLFQYDVKEVFDFKELPDFATQENQEMLNNELDRTKYHISNNSFFIWENKTNAPVFWEGFGMLGVWDEQEYFNASLDQTLIPNRRFVHLFLLCVISPSDIFIVSDSNCNHYTVCDGREVVESIWFCWFVFNASEVFDEYIPYEVSEFVKKYHLEHKTGDFRMVLEEIKNNEELINQLTSVWVEMEIKEWWVKFMKIKGKSWSKKWYELKKQVWSNSKIIPKTWKYWETVWHDIEKNIKIKKELDNELLEQ
jgi:hypothetical protein